MDAAAGGHADKPIVTGDEPTDPDGDADDRGIADDPKDDAFEAWTQRDDHGAHAASATHAESHAAQAGHDGGENVADAAESEDQDGAGDEAADDGVESSEGEVTGVDYVLYDDGPPGEAEAGPADGAPPADDGGPPSKLVHDL